jgi:prepilin-type N-terminal cleavage/methylation domain-containing protein
MWIGKAKIRVVERRQHGPDFGELSRAEARVTGNVRHRSAFTLLELLVVLALLAVVAAVTVPLARWCVLAIHNSESAESAALRTDNAVSALRRDVWEASSLRTPPPNMLVLTRADGHVVVWESQRQYEALVRTEAGREAQQWGGWVDGASFTQNGASVVVTIPDRPDHRGGTICMASQSMMIVSAKEGQ